MRMYSADGRSRWPWVIGALVLAVIIAGVVVFTTTRGTGHPAAAAPPTVTVTPTPTPSVDESGASDEDPTGCLGGPNYDATSVLTAQKAAPDTQDGAVEVAAAFYRFWFQYPYASVAQQKQVATALRSSSSPAAMWTPTTNANTGDNPTKSVLPAGTHFTMSTVNGLWRATSTSNGELIVDLAAGYVVDGALSPTKVGVLGFYMKWENGAWKVVEGHVVDQQALAADGTHFIAGC
ncbi:hypothetical protein ACFOYW_16970 [Gryllotalpicola reticulitermitis]|uniref:Integral membrane protein n=1 Tax=Gryllotalpicola reticulitermitis TaxID=1184153 RepID=A0ABV8Q9M7_9MICO